MIAVMVGPSRLPALAVHDASSVCVASGGVLELAYWLRSVEARDLAACHGSTQPSASPTHGSRLDLTLGMEALPEARQDRHWTATAMVVWGRCQQRSVTAGHRLEVAYWQSSPLVAWWPRRLVMASC